MLLKMVSALLESTRGVVGPRCRDGKGSTWKSPLKHAAAVLKDTSRLTGGVAKQMRSVQMMKELKKPTGTVPFAAISESSDTLATFSRRMEALRHNDDTRLDVFHDDTVTSTREHNF